MPLSNPLLTIYFAGERDRVEPRTVQGELGAIGERSYSGSALRV